MACWQKDVWSRLSNTEDKAFLLSMQNDRTASIAGNDITMRKLEMKQQQRKEVQVRREHAEEMRKNEEATVAMLANSFDDQFSSTIICTRRYR